MEQRSGIHRATKNDDVTGKTAIRQNNDKFLAANEFRAIRSLCAENKQDGVRS